MNSISVEKNLGEKYVITVESESILECIEKISVFSQIKGCTCCGETSIYLSHRKVTPKVGANAGKSFVYYDFVCRACGAKANIGMYNGGGIFLKEFKTYEKDADAAGPANGPESTTAPVAQQGFSAGANVPAGKYAATPQRF